MDALGRIKAEVDAASTRREWLTVPELALLLAVPRTRAYELIQRGELPAVRLGERTIRVNRKQLERFLLEERQIVGK